MNTPENLFTFTKTALTAIVPTGKRAWYRDTKTQGLNICVTPVGSKTFYVVRRVAGMGRKGNNEFLRLGTFPDEMTVEQARLAARKKLQTLNAGESVRANTIARKEELTVGDLWDIWKTERAVGANPDKPIKRSWKKDQRLYDCHLKSRSKRRIGEITVTLANKIFRDVTVLSGPVEANHVKRLARAMWNHVSKQHRLDAHNPWPAVKSNHEAEREEWVKPAEMPALFKAIDSVGNQDAADMIRLCLFTAARSGNVKAMRWDQIDLASATWTIPSSHHKNKKTHTIPLPPVALQILHGRIGMSREWVFPSNTSKSGHMSDIRDSWKAALKTFASELELPEIPDLRIHDLRHTIASWLVGQGVTLPMVGKTLGHTSMQSTARYSHLAIDPIRLVLNRATESMSNASKRAD